MTLVAVTGGTGFLGRAALRELSRSPDLHVRVLSRTPPPDVPTASYVAGELTDPVACGRLVADADVVIHLAGLVRSTDAAELERVNVTGTETLARAARMSGTRRFVHVSTTGVYGRPGKAVDEDSAHAPIGSYEGSKARAEAVLASELVRGTTVVVRPSNVIGTGNPRQPLRRFLSRVANSSIIVHAGAWTNYVDVDDVARVIAAAATSDDVPGDLIVNVPLPMRDFVRLAGQAVGRSGRSLGFSGVLGGAVAPLLRSTARRTPATERLVALVEQTRYVTSRGRWFEAQGLTPTLALVLAAMATEYRIVTDR